MTSSLNHWWKNKSPWTLNLSHLPVFKQLLEDYPQGWMRPTGHLPLYLISQRERGPYLENISSSSRTRTFFGILPMKSEYPRLLEVISPARVQNSPNDENSNGGFLRKLYLQAKTMMIAEWLLINWFTFAMGFRRTTTTCMYGSAPMHTVLRVRPARYRSSCEVSTQVFPYRSTTTVRKCSPRNLGLSIKTKQIWSRWRIPGVHGSI